MAVYNNLPYTQLTGLNKCQNGDFASSTVAFYQKSINLSGYLHLWSIFRFNFRQLRIDVFHKIMVAVKNNFFQMHGTILQRVK